MRKRIPLSALERTLSIIAAAAVAAACASAAGPAAEPALKKPVLKQTTQPTATSAPGNYIIEGGWGSLDIRRDGEGPLRFSIETISPNAHLCSLEGEIVDGVAALPTDPGEPDCVVRFTPYADGVRVEGDGPACRYFCGARATFTANYRRPPPGCDDVSRRRARQAFQNHYDRKRYARALATLAPIARNCAGVLHWTESGRIANDIAITQHKLGQRDACLRTLAPFANDAARSDDEILNERLPVDAASYLDIVQAARTNLRLCKALPR